MDRIKEISSEINEMKQWPSFSSGDTITVTYKIKEIKKDFNLFKELLSKRGSGTTETFTIEKCLVELVLKEFFP